MAVSLKCILKEKTIDLYQSWKEIEKNKDSDESLFDLDERSLYIPFKDGAWGDILIQDLDDSILIIAENLSFTISSANVIKISKENLSIQILNDKSLIEILKIDCDINTAPGDVEGIYIKNNNSEIIVTMLKSSLDESEKMIYIKLITTLISYFLIS